MNNDGRCHGEGTFIHEGYEKKALWNNGELIKLITSQEQGMYTVHTIGHYKKSNLAFGDRHGVMTVYRVNNDSGIDVSNYIYRDNREVEYDETN